MDFDLEELNHTIPSNAEYAIRTIAGICTQFIDIPVTRSSLIYANQPIIGIDSKHLLRRDISIFLDNSSNDKMRGMPLVFGVTVLSQISSFLVDKLLPNPLIIKSEECKPYFYSDSMHIYEKCKLQNMNNKMANNQIVDADSIDVNEASMPKYRHNFEHDRLMRALCISLISSLLTYPLYSLYIRIAFDVESKTKSDHQKSWYKQMDFSSLYKGYSMHIAHKVLFESFVHYLREMLIQISPQIHSNRFVNRFVSKASDPFEYAMFVCWWMPAIVSKIACYPLLKMQNKLIMDKQIDFSFSFDMLKTLFVGAVGSTTRFMTELQMKELFGLWNLIRISHKRQYSELLFEQEDEECTICYGDLGPANVVFSPCGHKFCRSDAMDIIKRNMRCPSCRQPIQKTFTDLGAWKKIFLL